MHKTISTPTDRSVRLLVWNLPLRWFHWLWAAGFVLAWLSRDDRHLDLHVFAGYLFTALLVFRLVWGVRGGPYARFGDFAYAPRAVLAYLRAARRRRAPRHLGHNPAGGWAVYLMLAAGLAVAGTGLLTLGGEEGFGPLALWPGFAAGDAAHRVHELAAWSLLGLVVIHLLGVAAESWLQRENLVAAMITGRKRARPDAIPARPALWVAVALTTVLLAGTGVYFRGYLRAGPDISYVPFVGPALPDHRVWRRECGDCHLAYHPNLLPARSWRRLMAKQADHFGEDLALDPAAIAVITGFLVANAAESVQSEAAWKIQHSTPPQSTPLRITETRYWRRKHADVPVSVWRGGGVQGRGDCAACHRDADAGTFQDGAMTLPKAGLPSSLQPAHVKEVL